jgi:hypothetical protein
MYCQDRISAGKDIPYDRRCRFRDRTSSKLCNREGLEFYSCQFGPPEMRLPAAEVWCDAREGHRAFDPKERTPGAEALISWPYYRHEWNSCPPGWSITTGRFNPITRGQQHLTLGRFARSASSKNVAYDSRFCPTRSRAQNRSYADSSKISFSVAISTRKTFILVPPRVA